MRKGTAMESWRKVWREGVAPCLSVDGLLALADGLERDDQALAQGITLRLNPADGSPCEACALVYAAWEGDGITDEEELQEAFGDVCYRTGQRLAEPIAAKWFLNWFDETDRAEMRRELLPEVRLELERRATATAA